MIGSITYPAIRPAGLSETLAAEGVTLHLNGDQWQADDAATAQAVIDGYVGGAAELAYHKQQKLAALAELVITKYVTGFNYAGRTFQIDEVSIANINAQANAALGAIVNNETWPQGFYWIAADNSHMSLPTPQDMRTFAVAVKDYVAGLILVNRAIKDAIAAAADMDALAAIDVGFGWPANP